MPIVRRTNMPASSVSNQRSSIRNANRPSQRAASMSGPSSQPEQTRYAGHRSVSIAPSRDKRYEDDDVIHGREDEDSVYETVMAVDLRDRETVGCSYYVSREEKLYLMEDVKLGGLDFMESREFLHRR